MKEISELTKEEINDLLHGWVEEGKLLSKTNYIGKGHWYDVWHGVGKGEVFFTGHDRILATDAAVRDQFRALMQANRVMTLPEVTILHPEYTTGFKINGRVAQGKMIKFTGIPAVVLYIE